MNNNDVFYLDTPAKIDCAIATYATQGYPGRAALLRHVRAGDVLVMEITRDRAAPMGLLKRQADPLLVLIGDDDYATTGPDGWTAAPKLIRWAAAAMVHATGGDAHSYGMAVGMAITARRFLLVETSSSMARTWGERLLAARPKVPFVGLVPPSSDQHPMRPTTGEMQ